MQTHTLTVERVPALWFLLVKKFYQQHYPSGKPNKADPIWVLKEGHNIVSAVRLKQLSDCQLLTAMVTAPQHREKGLGGYLLNAIESALAEKACYCFAFSHLVPFYQKHGFCPIKPEQLPSLLAQRFNAYTAQGRQLSPMLFTG
ncbi:GNAT family N-acetyltransferase [Marinomonas pollencensis]|uniref:Acetyltransferase (GNAT) family protein n=1 Tax=Marinomonas pollencensis TaxID=491954 RepID=A0A3E0DEY1_9GAMM|nr:GNAT family N-acetyltransferase [Marinomonas pollencensis]REG81137.1 acetyltransferase (GNAT) family protein [Marinomonas pollencensis]